MLDIVKVKKPLAILKPKPVKAAGKNKKPAFVAASWRSSLRLSPQPRSGTRLARRSPNEGGSEKADSLFSLR
jgi:hypothetical protein